MISAIMCSCDSITSSKQTENLIKNDSIDRDSANIIVGNTHTSDSTIEEDTITNIKFEELSMAISRLIVFDTNNQLDKIQKDTVYLYAELGETIEGQVISITTNQLTNSTVEQRYETSVTIMDEGPHCDLVDWKHYTSEWEKLQSNKKGQYIGRSYSEKDWEKFPTIDISELKERVKEQCGKDWLKLISKIQSPTEYPSGVGVSRYFLRLTGQRKDNGQTITKLIIIEVAMGC